MDAVVVAGSALFALLIYTVGWTLKRPNPSAKLDSAAPGGSEAAPTSITNAPAPEPLRTHDTPAQAKPTRPRKRSPRAVPQITVDTPLGRISFKKPRRPAAAVIVALGQAEDHLRWFYDVYRKDYLKRAVAKLRAVERGTRQASEWNRDYFDFMQDAPRQLENLDEERDSALRENQEKIKRGEPTVLGTYETGAQARESARYLSKKREATLNAGWLQVHVVEITPQAGTGLGEKR